MPNFTGFSIQIVGGYQLTNESGTTYVLVTGGTGYMGSHAVLRLLSDSYRVTVVDNLSREKFVVVKVLQQLFPEPGRLQFIYADPGDAKRSTKFYRKVRLRQ